MTDTAKMADIVLPGSTFLERADLRHYLQHYGDTSLVLTKKVVEPIGNSMEDWKIFAELGKRNRAKISQLRFYLLFQLFYLLKMKRA